MGKSVLIMLLGYIMIFNIMSNNISRTSRDAEISLYEDYNLVNVKNIANSGINIALYKLGQDRDWRTGINNLQIFGGALNVSVSDRPDIGNKTVEIKSYSNFNGVSDSSNVIIDAWEINKTFSRFAYFSNTEPQIYFCSDDTLYGPVHTNGRFHMTGRPVFHGLVSSVSNGYSTLGYTDPYFYGGTQFNAPQIQMPTQASDLNTAIQNGGHYTHNKDLYLRFNGDGTFDYKEGAGGTWDTKSLSTINGSIGTNRDLYVEGEIDESVTIGADGDVYITDDITYKVDPRLNPSSEVIMGIISKHDVIVEDNANNRQGCTIEASVVALAGSFKAENTTFSPTAELEILGGVIGKTRGGVGKLNPRRGFDKMYRYDDRLEYLSPPYFPIASGSTTFVYKQSIIKFLYWMD